MVLDFTLNYVFSALTGLNELDFKTKELEDELKATQKLIDEFDFFKAETKKRKLDET